MIESDELLVSKSQRGDRRAFELLVQGTARLVYARLLLDTGDRHLAEDLTQETFFAAWRAIGQLEDAGRFRPWLLTIAQGVYIDALRRRKRQKRSEPGRQVADEAVMEHPDPSPTPDQAAQVAEARQMLLAALRELPEQYRQPLSLRYLAGADYHAIQQQLALSNGALRGLLSRGMTMLREMMRPS